MTIKVRVTMRHLVSALGTAAALLGGCGDGTTPPVDAEVVSDSAAAPRAVDVCDANPAPDADEPTRITADDVKAEVGEAITTTGRYVDQEKDRLVAAGRERLDELERRLAEWKVKAGTFSGSARVRFEEQITALEQQIDSAGAHWSTMKDTGAEAWEKTESSFAKAMARIQAAYLNIKRTITETESDPPSDATDSRSE